ncbi:MAG TPA: glycoside hydrolase family 78 protein, partial [Spirochaetia bacterium]|nr:glycoside hydrolase family 78 protein [Spirochaetia bacterium]
MKPGSLAATHLLCNGILDPLGVDTGKPLLSWIAESTVGQRGQRQTAYRIRGGNDPQEMLSEGACLWDTGWVAGGACLQIPWGGPPPRSRQAIWWAVSLRDDAGKAGAWSAPARWEMGLLDPGDWTARWVSADTRVRYAPTPALPAPFLRWEFDLSDEVQQARAYVCGLGWHELYLNGNRVGSNQLDPAFTRYDARALYVTHDVTGLLRKGRNAIGGVLGTGWYDQHAADSWSFQHAPWRDPPKLIAQVNVRLASGLELVLGTGPRWRWSHGPILSDAMRNGECYDAQREMPGWAEPGFDDRDWRPVCCAAPPGGRLVSQQMPPIRVTETITPVSVVEPGPGVFVVDMGRVMVGRARIRVRGKPGQRVTLKYAEKTKGNGDIDQSNIDSLTHSGEFQTDVYLCREGGTEWEPRFSTHGFRYVQLKGWPGRPTPADVDGRAVHTDLAGRGEFLSSNPLLNSIQDCCRRSTVYNYHGFPTDCPQRERNGWTGDAHCSAEQALLNFDMDAAYRKWMADIRDCQRPSGQIPAVVPTGGWGFTIGSGPAWDSAAILIPWYLYLYRGDAAILEEHYECMRRYVEFLGAMEIDGIVDFGLGDWCPPEWHPSVVWDPTYRCPVALTDTAYYHLDARILSKVAGLLGKAADEERYETLAARVRRAFREHFLDPATGRVAGDCQASLACALDMGMVGPEERDAVMTRLVQSVEAAGRHIDAGMLGAKSLLRALTDADRVDLAYAIATQTTYPGWGEWIRRGATTLWETWSGDSSLNHHAFSDISAWFYRALAGLRADADEPGFRHFWVRPHPAGDLRWVRARHASPYGPISIAWEIGDGRFDLDLAVPVGARATVQVPADPGSSVRESGAAAEGRPGVLSVGAPSGGRATVELACGTYRLR